MADQTYVSEILVEIQGVAKGLRDLDNVQKSIDDLGRSGRLGSDDVARLTKELSRADATARRSGAAYSKLGKDFKDVAFELGKASSAWKEFNRQAGQVASGPSSTLDVGKATTADLRAQQQAYDAIGRTREESVRRELAQRDRVAEKARASTQEQLRQNRTLADSEKALQAARDESAFNARVAGLSKEERAKEELARANKRLADSEAEVFGSLGGNDRIAQARAIDGVTQALREQDRAQEAVNRTTREAEGSLGNYDRNLTSLRYALFDVAGTLTAVSAGLIGGGGLVLSTFAEFEAGLATVSRTTGYTGAALDGLADQLQNLSTRVPVSVQGLTDIATAAGQMGIAGDDLLEFTEVIAQFATISDSLNAEDAASTLARIAQLTGTTNFRGVASAVAALSDELNATDQQIVQTAREVARAGAIAGLSADEVIGLSGALASLGVQPEGARSVLFQFFTTVDEAIRGANDNLDDFARLMGITEQEVANLYRNDPSKFILDFNTALAQVDPDNLSGALDALGIEGARAAPVFAVLAQNIREFGVEGSALGTAFATSNTAFNDMTLLAEKLQPFLETLSAQFQLLLNDLVNLAITVGEAAAPVMQEFIDIIRVVLEDLNAFAQTSAGQDFIELAAKIGTVVAAASAILAPLAAMTAGALAVRLAAGYAFSQISILRTGIVNLHTANLNAAASSGLVGTAASRSAVGMTTATIAARALSTALKAIGIGLLISFVSDPVNFLNGALGLSIDLMVGFITLLGQGYVAALNFAGNILQAVPALQTVADNALRTAEYIQYLLSFMGQFGEVLKGQARDLFNIPAPMKQGNFGALTTSVTDMTSALADALAAMEDADVGMGDLGNAAGDAAKPVDDLAQKVRTLVDYASDLQGVFSRAFELRFSSQSTYDAVSTSFMELGERFQDAARSIRDLRQNIRELNADMTDLQAQLATQRYFLSIETNYGGPDSARAGEIRARIAELEAQISGKRNDLVDKSKELADAEQDNSKALTGNSKAAITNRKALTDLVSQYQEHLVALASSGASQEELASEAQRLRREFLKQARALGYAESELQPYAAAFDDLTTIIREVPRDVTVDFNTNPAIQALNEFKAKIDEVNAAMSGLGSGGVGNIGGGGAPFDFGSLFPDETALRGKGEGGANALLRGFNEPFKQGIILRSSRRGIDELADYLENYDLGSAIEMGLGDLGPIFTKQGPKIGTAMRSNGRSSQTQFKIGFENGLDLYGAVRDRGVKAAPALAEGGRNAGLYFRSGFSGNADISNTMKAEGAKGAPQLRPAGVSAGHWFRDGFNATANVGDIVNTKAAVDTSQFRNTGYNAAEQFKAGFRSTGNLNVALDMPSGLKAANNNLGKLRFFSDGGFTGRGGKYDPAGIVHKGEYVVPQHLVNQSTGLPYADAMGRLPRGSQASGSYAGGGFVGGGGANQPVNLAAGTIHALARVMKTQILLDGKDIARASNRHNANATSNGAR